MDIHNIDQVKRDPLKGQLIENMVVLELFKYRLNRNLSASYYFYRDSNMHEVDIIFKEANKLIPIEIKASKTFNMQFLKGLNYFYELAKNRVPKGYLIYAGDHEQKMENFRIINYKHIDKIFAR